ncbi:Mitochondrial inner membrane translocase [Salix suchowensis]|nr:Mitochondrial inner membrane translocase [Salix suchowensis]
MGGTEETISAYAPKMAGTVNWGTATVVGVFAGMLYGGSKEAAASVSKDAEVMLKLGSTPDKREQYRLMRDAMEKRFIRVTRGSIVGGYDLECSLLDSMDYKIYWLRNEGCMIFIMLSDLDLPLLQLPGSLRWRARNVLLGSVLGAAFCLPLGWIHLKLVEKANEGSSGERGEATSGVGAAIERLEGNLKKKI